MSTQAEPDARACGTANAVIDLARRRAAHTWPARRCIDNANQAPVTPDEIERWLDERAAELRAGRAARNEVLRARAWGYALAVVAGLALLVVPFWLR